MRNPSPVFLRWRAWRCWSPHARHGNLMFPHPLPLPRDGVLCVWRSGSRGRGDKFCGGSRAGVGTLGAFPRFWQPALSGLFACESHAR